ncbi:restriction endonuclease subunit S [Lacticaseibacillus paracasei]|uniref:restriction endonuclease subunit S n=1 Tax=Lacticaseibacillus paracasei TaxID=1597 RepID=UPI000F43BCEC|nr:restriction endonuclease subunit S [Lacticaseibacillus paracasei]RND36622.1 Type I restriction modification DNA specificity domain protein [Lacticaseibacillus paracasei]
MGDVVERVTRKNRDLVSTRPLTISAQDGLVDQRKFFSKTVASKNISNYFLLKAGDFAYNKSYSVGYPWGAVKRLDKYPSGVLSTLYIVFKPKKINSQFLVTYFEGTTWYVSVSKVASEGARNHGLLNISASDFFDQQLFFPTKKTEQESIGFTIKVLDDLIAATQDKIDALEQAKRALLQRLFDQSWRFKGYSGSWEKHKLGDLAKRVRGNDGRMDLPILTISAGNGWLTQKERFSQSIAGNELKNYTLLAKNELSYNHGNSKLAKYGAVFALKKYNEALVPRVYHSFDVSGKADSNFIEYLFSSKTPDHELRKLISSGARMDGLLNINYASFMNISLLFPSIEEQQKISRILEIIRKLSSETLFVLSRLAQIKKDLLQELFI